MGTVTDQPIVAASVLEWDGLRLSMRTETDGDVVMPSFAHDTLVMTRDGARKGHTAVGAKTCSDPLSPHEIISLPGARVWSANGRTSTGSSTSMSSKSRPRC